VSNRDIEVVVTHEPVKDLFANALTREPVPSAMFASNLHYLVDELEHVCLPVTRLANDHLDQDLLFRGAVASQVTTIVSEGERLLVSTHDKI
jgi:hypothetical protein